MPSSKSQGRTHGVKQKTGPGPLQIRRFRVKDIIVQKKRPIDPKLVADLAMSIGVVGLQNPITVHVDNHGRPHLVAGNHRRAAHKLLGRKKIDCVIVEGTLIDDKLREATENLHRSRMTALERAELTVNWWSAIERKTASLKKSKKPQQRADKGIRRAAKHLGMSRDRIRRSMAIAALPAEVKAAATKAKLHNNQKILLALSRLPSPREQIAEIQKLSNAGSRNPAKMSPGRTGGADRIVANVPKQTSNPVTRDGRDLERLKIAWTTVMSGREEWRESSRKCRKTFCKWLKSEAAK